jgi:DNA-directed RNA polymerase subunit K/omega
MNDTSEQREGTATVSQPASITQSRFMFVDVAALRAKQLRRGALPRFDRAEMPLLHKAERVAMEEVRRGLVFYEVPEYKPASGKGEA